MSLRSFCRDHVQYTCIDIHLILNQSFDLLLIEYGWNVGIMCYHCKIILKNSVKRDGIAALMHARQGLLFLARIDISKVKKIATASSFHKEYLQALVSSQDGSSIVCEHNMYNVVQNRGVCV